MAFFDAFCIVRADFKDGKCLFLGGVFMGVLFSSQELEGYFWTAQYFIVERFPFATSEDAHRALTSTVLQVHWSA